MAFSPNVPGDDEIALNAKRDCIQDLKDWMIRDQFKLNDHKTEFLLIGTKQQLEKVNFSSVTVGDALIEAKSKVRNVGNMSIHVSKLCASAFYHLHNIGHIRKFLSVDATKALVHAFAHPRRLLQQSFIWSACHTNQQSATCFKCCCEAGMSRAALLSRYILFARAALATGKTAD